MAQLPNVDDELNSQDVNDVVDDASDGLMGDTQEKLEQMKNAPQNVKDKYNQAKDMGQKIKDTPQNIKNGVNNAKNTAKKVGEGVKKTGKAVKDIKNLPKKIANGVKNIGKTLKDGIKNAPKNIANGIKDALNPKKFLDRINPINKVKRKIENVKNTVNKIKNAPKNIANKAKKTANAIKNAPKKIANGAKKTVNAVKKTIKAVQKAIKITIKAIKMAIKAIQAAIKLAIKAVQALIQLIQLLIQIIIATWPIWVVALVLGLIIGVIWWILDNDSTSDNKSYDEEKTDYNETTLDSEGNVVISSISGTTKVTEAFYQYFAEKSLWVVYDGTVYNDTTIEHDDEMGNVFEPVQVNSEEFNMKFLDEDGNVILKDYQGREAMFYINPNALFVYDKALHGQQIRFPEQIVEHVAYDMSGATEEETLTNLGRFTLKQLTDDERKLTITSQKYKLVSTTSSEVSDEYKAHAEIEGGDMIYIPDGDNEEIGVWDYGLGSILHYVKYLIKHEKRGSYHDFQVWDGNIVMEEDGTLSSGVIKKFDSYEEYEDTPDDVKANYDATDIAELKGDDRLVTYKYDEDDPWTHDLADEDAYFIDWVVTPAGDVSNNVIYEWIDSGEAFSRPETYEKKVTRTWEEIHLKDKNDQVINKPASEQLGSNSSQEKCSTKYYYYEKKVYPRPVRDADRNLLALEWDETSKKQGTWTCSSELKWDCGGQPLNVNNNTSNDNDAHDHEVGGCTKSCAHKCGVLCLLGCTHECPADHSCYDYTCDGSYNVNNDTSDDNDAHEHSLSSCAHHYDHSSCQKTVTLSYKEEYLKECEEQVMTTFTAHVNGTLWNKEPYYDGEPNLDNVTGRRYYEDYLVNYDTYVPYSVTTHLDTADMLKRIQLEVTDPDLATELEKILERDYIKNGLMSNSSSSGGGVYGEGSNKFEQFYNGSDENKEIIHRIWDGLISWGYKPEQAAAVLGNIAQESTYNPTAVNPDGGASGLCQWLGGRLENLKAFAASNGADWTDLTSQIQFACMELDGDNVYSWTGSPTQWAGHASAYETFKTSSDPGEIALVIMTDWERSGESVDSASGQQRRNSALSAYATLSGRTPEYTIDVISPSGGSSPGGESGGISSFFGSIWSWLKGAMSTIKQGITSLFGFENEYYTIMDQKERYKWTTYNVAEDEVDYILQSVFAYTENVPISTYYGEIDDEFFLENFAKLFSNPIGISWTGSTTSGSPSQSASVTLNKKLMDENYPDGFQKPLETCKLSGTTSNYGIYIQATDGENVFAACDGTIIDVGEDDRYGGKYVILSNGHSKTIYGCLKDIYVTENQTVTKGQVIATVSGSELFFGITNMNNVVVNPSFVLTALGDVVATYPTVGPYQNMPRILQSQEAIGSYGYGSSTISKSGCGICAFTMVASALNDTLYSPIEIVDTMDQIAKSKGRNYTYYYCPGAGSYGGVIFPELSAAYGLQTSEISGTADGIKSALNSGKVVVVSIKNNGSSIYKGSGHFIVIRGYDSSTGKFYVNDSAKCYSENSTYSLTEIGTIKSARAIWK